MVTLFHNLGAVETNVQVAETGWWLGTYDKEQQLHQSGRKVVNV